MTNLVQQIAALNVNIQGVIQGQEVIKRSISSANPTDNSAGDVSPSDQQNPPDQTQHPAAISNHTRLLPNGVRLSEKTARNALSGEFINLAEFLPMGESTTDTDLEPIVDNDAGNLTFRTIKSKRSIDTLSLWMTAWNNYEFLLVSADHSRYADMAKYRNFIQKCSQKFIWHAVYAYDCRFRSQLTNDVKRFGTVDTDIYTSLFDITVVRKDGRACHRCKSRDHVVTDCPFPATTSAESKTSAARNFYDKSIITEVCRNFNTGKCRYPSCRRKHVCQSCGGTEPEYRCPCPYQNTTNIELSRMGDLSRQSSRP